MSPLEIDPGSLADDLLAVARTGGELVDELSLCREYQVSTDGVQAEHRELPARLDAHNLGQTGWALVLAHDEDPAIEQALAPLLERRQRQAGKLYKRLVLNDRERAGEFLHRHEETPGVIRPEKIPYYLLIVGGPEKISWKLQAYLNINRAVGRLSFDDIATYARYAEGVVAAEKYGVDRPRKATLFSVENDDTTRLLSQHLAEPLNEQWPDLDTGWELETRRREEASSDGLRQWLTDPKSSGLLLASCHGLSVPPWKTEQIALQGALCCQDGKKFSGCDVDDGCQVEGLMVLMFACYGAGTPVRDNFPEQPKYPQLPAISEVPFVSSLAKAFLARGALAVVGHVDRGWTYSFAFPDDKRDRDISVVASLHDALSQLLRGDRLGHAMRPLYQRYKSLAADLSQELELSKNPRFELTDKVRERLTRRWIAHNDARNFVILGDPAVYALGRRDKARPEMKRRRSLRFGGFGSRAVVPQAETVEDSPGPAPSHDADLTIRVLREYREGIPRLRYEVTASDKELDLVNKSFGPVAVDDDSLSYIEPFFAELQDFTLENPQAVQTAEEKIVASGATLASALLPPDLQELLLGLHRRKQVRTLLVQSKQDWIPWELLKLADGPFLCEAFALSRWQDELGFKGRLHLPLRSMAFLSPDDAGLSAVEAERVGLESLLEKTRRTLRNVESTYLAVVSDLGKAEFEGWHFAGHGLADTADSNFWTIDLGDGKSFHPKDLRGKASGFAKARPLVFFNGCFTGRVGKSLSRAGGWAAQWMELGAGAFVGTSWAVRDNSAAAFAKEFYASFLAGNSLAEAVQDARLQIKKDFPGDPAWLTYVAYGHPCARCATPPARIGRFLAAAAILLALVLLSVNGLRGWRDDRFDQRNNSALEQWKNGDWPGAEKQFRAALEIKDGAQAHASLGQVLALQNRWEEAFEAHERSVELEPEVADYHSQLGSLLLRRGRADEARRELQRAIDLDPDHLESYNELGRAYLEIGMFAQARERLETAVTLNDERKVVAERKVTGQSSSSQTEPLSEDAEAVLRKNLGRVLFELGALDRAEAELSWAGRHFASDNHDAWLEAAVFLARTRAELQEVDAACDMLGFFRDRDPAMISTWAPQAQKLARELGCSLEEGG